MHMAKHIPLPGAGGTNILKFWDEYMLSVMPPGFITL